MHAPRPILALLCLALTAGCGDDQGLLDRRPTEGVTTLTLDGQVAAEGEVDAVEVTEVPAGPDCVASVQVRAVGVTGVAWDLWLPFFDEGAVATMPAPAIAFSTTDPQAPPTALDDTWQGTVEVTWANKPNALDVDLLAGEWCSAASCASAEGHLRFARGYLRWLNLPQNAVLEGSGWHDPTTGDELCAAR